MGLVQFTARRSMLASRVAGELVTLEVGLTDAIRRRDVRKFPHRASAGGMETLYEGADTVWDLEFQPAQGDLYARLREFADSTASGEPFSVWVYGTEGAPVVLKRIDSGYSPVPFMASDDHLVLRITGVEQ